MKSTAESVIENDGFEEIQAEDVLDVEAVTASKKQEFSINSHDAANWAVRKIREWRSYRRRIDQWYEQEKRRADQNEDFLMRRFGDQLRDWAAIEVGKLHRSKSLNLPSGRIGFRAQPKKLVIDDEVAALIWARKSLPAAVITVERLSRSAVNTHFKETGEMPSGAHLEPSKEVFHIS